MPLRKLIRRSQPSDPIRVLIADDEPQVRRAIRLLFDRDGRFEVIAEAGDGAQAARDAEAHQPDVVILDLAMPGTDGLTAIPQILRAAPDSKIIVLSSMVPFENVREKAVEAGAHAVHSKYLSPKKLVKAVADSAKGGE